MSTDNKLHKTIQLLYKWGCTEQQIKRLLGVRYPKTLEMFTQDNHPITEPMKQRIGYIEQIDDVLSCTFRDSMEFLRYDFMSRRNDDPIFRSELPLQFVLRGIKNLESAAKRLSELREKRETD